MMRPLFLSGEDPRDSSTARRLLDPECSVEHTEHSHTSHSISPWQNTDRHTQRCSVALLAESMERSYWFNFTLCLVVFLTIVAFQQHSDRQNHQDENVNILASCQCDVGLFTDTMQDVELDTNSTH